VWYPIAKIQVYFKKERRMKRAVLVGAAAAGVVAAMPCGYFATKTEGIGHDVSNVNDDIVGSIRSESKDLVVTVYENQGKTASAFMRAMMQKHDVRFTKVK
jgi:hypothetical protein